MRLDTPAVSVSIFLTALFVNLPFRKTYIETGVGDKLVKTGLYSLARHPGAMWFILFMASLVLVSQSRMMLVAAPIFMVMNTLLVIIQDKVFFTKMFAGYDQYQKETPMLLPNRRSINVFLGRYAGQKQKSGLQGGKPMTTLDELFRQGSNEELWQRCCGFIDLSLPEFMNIHRGCSENN